jgi:diguanylate cyclase (GGDEF)-like protein
MTQSTLDPQQPICAPFPEARVAKAEDANVLLEGLVESTRGLLIRLDRTAGEALDRVARSAGDAELRSLLTRLKTEISYGREELRQGVEELMMTGKEASAAGVAKDDFGAFDHVTGLPTREAAMATLHAASRERRKAFVAAFALDGLPKINRRFGYATGDEVLTTYGCQLAGALPMGTQLFRWGGPMFVGVLHNEPDVVIVRAEVARIATAKFSYTLDTGTREIMLVVSVRWAVDALPHDPSSVSGLIRKIDQLLVEPED